MSTRGNWMIYLSRGVPEQIKLILAMFSFCSCWQSGLQRNASCDKSRYDLFAWVSITKTKTFQISAHRFHSPWFPNSDYLSNDLLCRTSASTHSLSTFTMSPLNKNLSTINCVIPQIRKPIGLLMEIDWMGQVSSHPGRMNMQISSICFESPVVILDYQIPQRLRALYLLGLSQCTVWYDFRAAVPMCVVRTTCCAVLSPISVIVRQGLAVPTAANNMADRRTFHLPAIDV